MKFGEIPVERKHLRVKAVDGTSLERYLDGPWPPRVKAIIPSSEVGVFDLVFEDAVVPVTPVHVSEKRQLINLLVTGPSILAELTDPAADGSVELRIAFFVGEIIEFDDVEIGVDEYVQDRAKDIVARRLADVWQWLGDECSIRVGGEDFFLVMAGPAIEDDLLSSGPTTLRPTLQNSFCIVGREFRFVSTSMRMGDTGSIFVISRMTQQRRGNEFAVRLARGKLRFRDWSQTGQIRILADAQLRNLTADRSSYLRRWDEYLDLEGERFLKSVREFGALSYSLKEAADSNGVLTVNVTQGRAEAFEQLRLMSESGEELQHVTQLPEYVTNPEMSYSEYSSERRRLMNSGENHGDQESGGGSRLSFKVENWDPQQCRLWLKVENLPPDGWLIRATAGHDAQIDRRLKHRDAVLKGRSANPQVGLLIEEGGKPTSLRSPQKVKPLSKFVMDKVFVHPPTLMQERAIEVALNTPDIALIQGPPGTGKTTVIAAILERLNELSTIDGVIRAGKVLLTGFQQDAVENLIGRISLNGLPVPKFGLRTSSNENHRDTFQMKLGDWCDEIAYRLREQNPLLDQHEEERKLQDLYAQYLQMPSHRLGEQLVLRIKALDPKVLGVTLLGEVERVSLKLATREIMFADSDRFFPIARRLRTRPESFADDGPDRASDALQDLADFLSEPQSECLRRAASWTDNRNPPPFLPELADLKRSLLRVLSAPPVFRVEKHNDEVIEIARSAIERVREAGLSATDRKTSVLAAFLSELENDRLGLVNAISTYSFAYAATIQQSAARWGRDDPRPAPESGIFRYEYVIVDEAARVAPPDLMIALAQGKRVVLVGDHRQLPHLVEKTIEEEMEKEIAEEGETAWLRKSMFELLFSERLGQLEERDGIQRRVTLDKQFRMHPLLGDFISRVFYERNDPNERFTSGLGAGVFAHNLPGTFGRPALWIDVPARSGAMEVDGTKRYRISEIAVINDQLQSWLGSPEGSGLTFGVIAFYKEQAVRLERDLTNRVGRDPFDRGRVKVGTVDAFQGMEFDVVFLSVVRTSSRITEWTSSDRKRDAQRLFGHLCLSNRLNVSMSRQKKLLVVVGDSGLLAHDLAEEFIPGLVEFHRMASGIDGLP